MRKIISLSIEEWILNKIEEKRGLASRSRYIEVIIEDWLLWQSCNEPTDDPIDDEI